MPLLGPAAIAFERKHYTCVRCGWEHAAGTGLAFATRCKCGNELHAITEEPGVVYVIAASYDTAERLASIVRHRVSRSGSRDAAEAYERWLALPLLTRKTNSLYAIKRFAVVDTSAATR